MSATDDALKGLFRSYDQELADHGKKLSKLKAKVDPDPVVVPEPLRALVSALRDEGTSNDEIVDRVIAEFGRSTFGVSEIAAALEPAQPAHDDEPSAADPDDESGSDEAPGE